MNSIKYFLSSLFYKSLFELKLSKITRIYKDKIVESFDLSNSTNSYWIECNKEYVCPPQIVEDNKEFYGSCKKQSKIIMKNWQYFPSSAQKDILGLIKYIAWLRKAHLNKKQHIIYQKRVSDHIYEM